MLDQRRAATRPEQRREQLFTERYESLLAWALRLTNRHHEAAEDLVQDAFVQFMLGRTGLEQIENIDGYLRRMLRYMHVSRMSRSAQHLHETALSVADYDSVRLGWTAIEPPRRMQASEELHQICAYACSRKESSRAGSVLILRFSHDYFPIEIAGILNTSRHCVDQWQRLARREVKVLMNKPGSLRFVKATAPTEQRPIRYLRSECDLMLALRQMIFTSCQGDCLSPHELKTIYSEGCAEALTTRKLAHIVSCASCLDAVNGLLGLPLLAERYHAGPFEVKDPPPHDKTGGGASAAGSADLTKKLAHRLREIHEHKPHELRIAVNGFLVSSLKVSSESSELNLNLTPQEPTECVEVCSEQGVQLLFFSVDPGKPQCEQWARIELSEGRFLRACFRTENGPSLHVIYKDPAAVEAHVSAETPSQNFLSSPLSVVSSSSSVSEPRMANERGRFHPGLWIRWLGVFLRIARSPAEGSQRARDGLPNSLNDRFQRAPFLTLLGKSQLTHRKRAWTRLLIGLMSVAAVAGFLCYRASLVPAVTATALLEKARVTERLLDEVPDQVKHRLINFEERRGADGAIVARRKIEIWGNPRMGNRSQRLYDDSNRMIAGVWQTASGSRTVYQHGSKPQSQPLLASPDNLLFSLEEIWQLEPSAQAFSSLIVEATVADVEELSATYVVRYEKDRTIGASLLLKATLTLSKSDLRPIGQTLLVQRGGETLEYRFIEASFELMPVNAAAPGAFEIEPELIGGTGGIGRPGDWALRDPTSSRVPPTPGTSAPPVASAELEVDVAYLLNQVKADRNEQVALTRSVGGSLRVEGVVDSQQRKDEFLKVLGPLSNNPAVRIEIRTIAEATQRAVIAGSVSVQEAEPATNVVAADDDLRAHFSKNDPGGSTDEAIRSYSSRTVNRAYRVLFHSIELKRLVNRFTNVDMRMVAPDARAKWIAMVREHSSALARENAVLRQEIAPVFFPGASFNVAEEPLIQTDADLARVVERLHKLALSNNEAIRLATISSQRSATAIRSATFWQSIQRVERL